jgi:hypothetical protein
MLCGLVLDLKSERCQEVKQRATLFLKQNRWTMAYCSYGTLLFHRQELFASVSNFYFIFKILHGCNFHHWLEYVVELGLSRVFLRIHISRSWCSLFWAPSPYNF